MKRCIWSNRRDERVREVTVVTVDRFGGNPHERTFPVLPEHEAQLRAFNERLRAHGRRFLALLVLESLLMGVAAVLGALLHWKVALGVVGLGAALTGVTVLVFPCATPETIGLLGIARSIRLARAFGTLTLVIGLALAGFAVL